MGKVCKIPIIPVIQNTVVIKEHIKLNLYRLLLPFVDQIITVANMQKDQLVKKENFPGSLISVIYNSIDVQKFRTSINKPEKRRSLGLDDSGKIVGIVTRLVHLKGIDVFLKAAQIVIQKHENVQFIIVGDGPERSKMKSMVARLKIDKGVHFLGVRDDINEVVPLFDVAVLSSRTEALPLVVLEYMASGRSIVATSVGSVPELVIDGDTGLLVQPENPDTLAEKILFLLNNEDLANEMGSNARRRVHDKFRIELAVEKTERLIAALVNDARVKGYLP